MQKRRQFASVNIAKKRTNELSRGETVIEIVVLFFSYHQRDNMRIALNIDVSLLLSQLVFFIGLSTNDNMVRNFSRSTDSSKQLKLAPVFSRKKERKKLPRERKSV